MNGKAVKLWFGGLILANLIYLAATSANHVGYVDSGELAVACHTLGIAHPTGYPLYTLLGKVFSLLCPGSTIKAVSLLSTLFGIGSGILFVVLCTSIFKHVNLFANASSERLLSCSSAMVVLLYGPTMWSLFTTNEVYSLHLFFVTAILLVALNMHGDSSGSSLRLAALGSYILGVSFSHHLSTALVIPAILFWVSAVDSIRKQIGRLIPVSVAAFVAPLSACLYLPIRSSLSPIANWGDPSNLERLVRHVSGWQYRIWMFNKSISGILNSMSDLLALIIGQLPAVLLIPAVFGLAFLTVRSWKLSVFIATVFVTNLIYIAGYTIPETDTYLLPSIMIYVLWAVTGSVAIIALLANLSGIGGIRRLAPYITAAFFLAVGLFMIDANKSYGDRSDYRYVDTQTRLLLENMEPDAVFLTSNWDFYSPLLYSRFVEGFRTDVTAIDVELLRRSWYYKFISASDRALYSDIEPQVIRFLPHVQRFERGEPYSLAAIEDAFQSIITSLASIAHRPVYVDRSTKFRDDRQFTRVPNGPVYRLVRQGEDFTPRPFSMMSLGQADPKLLERDYSLRKQIGIIEYMNVEWRTFWNRYLEIGTVTPGD